MGNTGIRACNSDVKVRIEFVARACRIAYNHALVKTVVHSMLVRSARVRASSQLKDCSKGFGEIAQTACDSLPPGFFYNFSSRKF